MKYRLLLCKSGGNVLIYFIVMIVLLLGISIATLSMSLSPLRHSTDHARQYNMVEAAVISSMSYAIKYIQGATDVDGETIQNDQIIKGGDGEYVMHLSQNHINQWFGHFQAAITP